MKAKLLCYSSLHLELYLFYFICNKQGVDLCHKETRYNYCYRDLLTKFNLWSLVIYSVDMSYISFHFFTHRHCFK